MVLCNFQVQGGRPINLDPGKERAGCDCSRCGMGLVCSESKLFTGDIQPETIIHQDQ